MGWGSGLKLRGKEVTSGKRKLLLDLYTSATEMNEGMEVSRKKIFHVFFVFVFLFCFVLFFFFGNHLNEKWPTSSSHNQYAWAKYRNIKSASGSRYLKMITGDI